MLETPHLPLRPPRPGDAETFYARDDVGMPLTLVLIGFPIMFLGGLNSASEDGAAGGLILGLVLLVVAILIVVLVSNRAAGAFFAANRAMRGR